MLTKTLKTLLAAALIALAAPMAAEAANKMEGAEKHAAFLISHLNILKMEGEQAKRDMADLQKMAKMAKSPKDQHDIHMQLSSLNHRIHMVGQQYQRARKTVHDMIFHFRDRGHHLEQQLPRMKKQIEMMEKAKKPAAEIEKAKKRVEEVEKEAVELKKFFAHLEKEMRHH